MLQAVKKALQLIIDNIDSGNSNLTEEECITIVDTIKRLSQKEESLTHMGHLRLELRTKGL